jgi:protein-tyrosine phosphatase
MPALVIDLRKAEDWRDVVHQTVQSLVEGKIVAFPTETVYGLAASAMDERFVERLIAVKGRSDGHALTLAVKSADEARDYAPDMSPLAQRLARRCWPGPITLVLDDGHPEGLASQLPAKVRERISPAKTIGLRVPGHQLLLDVLRMLVGPLVLTSANHSGAKDSLTGREVAAALGSDIDVILDDGPCRFGEPSSVVRVEGNRYTVLRAGVVPEKTVHRLASMLILFVCTGNTCRSPMAEALCKKMISDRLKCGVQELEDRGVMVMSAGLAATLGGRAAPEAMQVMASMGVDLGDHETQPLTEGLVRHADVIYTMTRAHRDAILAQHPAAAERTFLLCSDESDVCDPIGGSAERYQRCATLLHSELQVRLDSLDFSG